MLPVPRPETIQTTLQKGLKRKTLANRPKKEEKGGGKPEQGDIFETGLRIERAGLFFS
jgi:hypothetical protein